ncbi:hypothetical protein CPC08DRAFT_710287 [Agrocybe pediades]|nr:hypothetical protein CPC08DRAFT_710287 [Agrocybe pediades]
MDIDQNSELRLATRVLYTQPDILYEIFQILIEGDGRRHTGLATLRHGSQVCMPWRDLLLSSPSLWGKSLDFDILMSKPAWRDEVIRRSGKSFVYITRIGNSGPRFFLKKDELFLGSFIKDNWQRVKLLRITLPVESVVTKLFDISLLQSPHPHIEELDIREHHLCLRDAPSSPERSFTPDVEPGTWRADFGGHAPMLRRYNTGTSFQFPYHTSWLPQLRALEATITACSIPSVLDELRNMKDLEHLDLSLPDVRTADPDARARMPNIGLPCLTYLDINSTGNTPESIDLLNYIKPRVGCRMYAAIAYRNALSSSDINTIVRAFAAFPWNAGEGRRDQQGWIEILGHLMRIRSPTGHQLVLRGPSQKELWTPCFHHFATSPSSFCNAGSVRLALAKQVVDSIPSTDITFTEFLSNMTSLSHLSTDWITLRLIRRSSVDNDPQTGSRKALPVLESIEITGPEANLNDLEVWLDCRATRDLIPIKHVRIYWDCDEDCPRSLYGFQRFTDMEVELLGGAGGYSSRLGY